MNKPAIVKSENLMPIHVGSTAVLAYDAWSPRWGRDTFLENYKQQETQRLQVKPNG